LDIFGDTETFMPASEIKIHCKVKSVLYSGGCECGSTSKVFYG